MSEPLELLRLPAVLRATGLSNSTVWRYEQRGDFPSRIRVGQRAVAWSRQEIEQWLATRGRGTKGLPDRQATVAEGKTSKP